MRDIIMPQVNVLDNVIRRLTELEALEVSSSETKKLIIIDVKKRKVLEKKPFPAFGIQLDFFLVSNKADFRNVAESTIKKFSIVDFVTDRSISVSVKYQVSCFSGNEGQVALALFEDSKNIPGIVFEGRLINWLSDYAEREISFSDFTTDYAQQLEKLSIYARNEARRIGLNLRLWLALELDDSDQLGDFSVDSGHFPVLLRDFEEQVNFSFQTNLAISQNGKVNAILNYGKLEKLKGILKIETRSYLRQNVYLHDFCYEFNNFVRSDLVSYLNQVLSPYGREIDGFFPNIPNTLSMPALDPIKQDMKHEIQGYGSVVIKNTLEIEPRLKDKELDKVNRESIVNYRRAKISNLDSWFRKELEKTIKGHLFDFSYVDVILKYNSREIKNLLDEAANKIGYSIRLISTVPDLKPIKLKTEGFKFELSETFSTKQNNVKIKLGIDVRGKIENLESIRDFLNDPRNDVEALIEREIVDSIKKVLHEVEPADFYAQEGLIYYFNDEYSSQEAIKDKTTEAIKSSLSKVFGATSSVTLQVLNTALLERINDLVGKAYHGFEILVPSVRDAGEPIRFTGSFQINGVVKDKWDTFASCKPEVEEVRIFLQDQLRYWCRSLKTETLNYDTTKGLLKLLGDANTLASKDVINSFGLLVSIHRFEPSDTELKKAQRSRQLAMEMEVLAEVDEKIQDDIKLRLIKRNISLKEIESLNQELETVRGLLDNLITQVGNENRRSALETKNSALRDKLFALVTANRVEASKTVKQKMELSIKPPAEESDFDDLVQGTKRSLKNSKSSSELQDSRRDLSVDDQVIDVQG